ncbi:hypothetical protein GCM10023160_09150 [Brachybacterium paraconglomeratum]|uniref:GmrSD restriction endonuclease domain-containing protein n=1 Tax=Brachybacterium paraconglomeratum TaxID=173362 RepID=UPI0031EE6637
MNSVSDGDLVKARDEWSSKEWDAHFKNIGLSAAGGSRYNAGGKNRVLKHSLLSAQERRCWFEGSARCESGQIFSREAQIDHVVPQKASALQLRSALESSKFQRGYFDVHDPGNLAVICGPCNQEKSNWAPTKETLAWVVRRERIESKRGKVIAAYNTWRKNSALDEATLKLLENVKFSDRITKDVFADLTASMIENLANQSGVTSSLKKLQEVAIETSEYQFSVQPSEDVVEYHAEMYAEMQAEDMRHGI